MEAEIDVLSSDANSARAASAPPLNILILEDTPTDAELIERELRKGGISFVAKQVERQASFLEALETFTPDVLLCDYALPDFTGRDALDHMRRLHPEVPVVMVTGTLGEEAAIELLNAGAKDYVLKNSLVRLPSAVLRAVSAEQGIRARKATEQALRRTEKRYRTLVTATAQLVWTTDGEGKVAEDIPLWSEFTGQGRADVLGDGWLAALHPDDRQPTMAIWKRAVETRSPYRAEYRVRRYDGEYRDISAYAVPVPEPDGTVREWIGTCADVTEQKRAKLNMRTSEERFRLVIETAPDAILLHDFDQNRFVGANRAAERLFACSRDQLLRYGPQHFYPPEQPDRRPVGETFAEHNRRALEGEEITYERRILNAAGEERLVQVTLVRLPSTDARLLRASMVDVTNQRRAELAMQRLNRTLRTLSRGNKVVVRATEESELLREMCWTIVEAGGYCMAWVGLVQQDPGKSVVPAAWAGRAQDFLERAKISWAVEPGRASPCGRAICTSEAQVIQDFNADPALAPLAALAREYEFRSCAALPLKDSGGTFAVLAIYADQPDAFDAEALELLQELANDLAYGIAVLRGRQERDQLSQRWRESLETTVGAVASVVELRDPYTAGHQDRVAALAVAIGRELNLPEEEVHGLRLASYIHDVGKINVPAEILSYPGKLSPAHMQIVREHAEAGYNIIKGVDFPWPIAEIVRQHHERLDGSGYPRGLKGGEILLEARIVAIADVVDAMTSHRPYRPGLGIDAALAEIEAGKGRIYDPAAAAACIRLFREKGFRF